MKQVVAIARQGLEARARLNDGGYDEREYLSAVEETVAAGLTPAEIMLLRYEGDWKGDIDRVFEDYNY